MKRFSQLRKINEHCISDDCQPGNALSSTGVTNHYTPIENIMLNVKNLFAVHLGVVVAIGEDGVSLKLSSSKFTDKDAINKVLYEYGIYRDQTLASYIIAQGLDTIKIVDLGRDNVVYFVPSDIKTTNMGKPDEPAETAAKACTEQLLMNIEEAELYTINEDDDEEIEDTTLKQLLELIDGKDKVKGAKQLEILVSQQMQLPREYYFAGVKDANGDESIALRWRYTSKRANNMSSTVTYSLINIYNTKEEGIWVAPFAEDSILKLPDEVQKLVDNILKDVLHAKQSKNKAVWTVGKEAHEIEDEDEDKDKDKDKDEDKDTDKDDESGKEKDDEKKSDKKSDVDDELDALLNGDDKDKDDSLL